MNITISTYKCTGDNHLAHHVIFADFPLNVS